MDGTVRALRVFDDGGGPDLYVGGDFTLAGGAPANRIARWDGSSWSQLGSGMDEDVNALAVLDDGGGPALYAGGLFSIAGGTATNRIAKWDGSSWSALGTGIGSGGGSVLALCAYDDGGSDLYAAGAFLLAGGAAANRIARWNGSAWEPLGSGTNATVRALQAHDDGSGPALFAAGEFTSAGGSAASGIARWDGSTWDALGSGLSGPGFALTEYDDGGGPVLLAAGDPPLQNFVSRWDGAGWTAISGGFDGVISGLAVYDDGSGPAPFAGGGFQSQGSLVVNNLAQWDGASWAAPRHGVSAAVKALAVHDGGAGPELYVGGRFTTAGGEVTNAIARWDGSSWSALGVGMSGIGSSVLTLCVYDDGSGPALHAGGRFAFAGSVGANNIAKWTSAGWAALGTGVGGGTVTVYPTVNTLAVYDDGNGPALYAGGGFTDAGGMSANRVARWDGAAWSNLGFGVGGSSEAIVNALAVFDDGGGAALYAGGEFASAGLVAASRIAKWDGSRWWALGSGLNGAVHALAVHDDGGGPALYVGGAFTTAGGVAANGIARWDGTSWSALGGGLSGGPGPIVLALCAFDDGSGPRLYAGGTFTSADGAAAEQIAQWDGSSWDALGGGVAGNSWPFVDEVAALAVLGRVGPDIIEPSLIAGGDFLRTSGSGDSYVARWGGPLIRAKGRALPR